MRKYILILPLLLSFAFVSCQKDEISGESIFKETESRYTEFDDWLHRHYVEPYNIRFEYRMPDRETSFGYWVSPPNIKESIMIAKLIKFTTVDAMVEMMSNDNENEDPTLFVKKYFPKVVFMVGSFEISSGGTVALASAENGLQINILGVNFFEYHKDAERIAGTMLHEFTHILDGIYASPAEFKDVTPSDYVGDRYTSLTEDPLKKGYVSNYARSSFAEDVATATDLATASDLPVSTVATVTDLTANFTAEVSEDAQDLAKQLAQAKAELSFYQEQLAQAKENGWNHLSAQADEILEKLNAGADFDALIDEYNQDSGMAADATARKNGGYAVCEGYTSFDSDFLAAALALEKVGDVSGKVNTQFGTHILQYTSDVTEGAVELDTVRDVLQSELLSTKQNEVYDAQEKTWVSVATAPLEAPYATRPSYERRYRRLEYPISAAKMQ